MTSEQVLKLGDLNRKLGDLLERMNLSKPLSSSEDLAELLKGVVEAGEWIQEPPPPMPDPVRDAALQTYRTLLERLKGVLPVLEIRLRMERAQLESERSQLAVASQWTEAAKATFSSR
jgi:hypothetical protein